uniref:Uncharacterized protein n=1 Tax=mine drainage metagenome TaxID=410659 RepID=E6QM11_9ZZZZ
MTRKASSDLTQPAGHPQNNANRALRDACVRFDEQLKAFIKNAHNDQDAAHVAAQVLFEVRRLENALSSPLQALPIRLSADAGFSDIQAPFSASALAATEPAKVTVIPPVDKEDV